MKDWKPTVFKSSLTPLEAVELRGLLTDYMQSHSTEMMLAGEIISDFPDAEIVLWDKSMFDLAWNGQRLFLGHTIPDDIGARRPELWLLNWGGVNEHDIQHPSQIMFVTPRDDQQTVCFYDICPPLMTGDKTTVTMGGELRAGTVLDHPDENYNLAWGADWALIEFLKSPIITSEPEKLPRHIRRQAKRENVHEPIVRVIRLRRTQKRVPLGSDGTSGGMDYSCQWPVRPHWRNQYYSSTGEHKPVFIDAYIKGPKDKPLKLPKNFIFKVDR